MKGKNKNTSEIRSLHKPVLTEQINSPYSLPAARLGSKPFLGETQMTAQAGKCSLTRFSASLWGPYMFSFGFVGIICS